MWICLIVIALVLLAWIFAGSFQWHSASRPRAAVIVFSYFPEDPRPRRETEALIKRGFEVEVFCLRKAETDRLHEKVNGASVYRLPLRRRRFGKFTYAFQYAVFLIASFLFLGIRSYRGYRLVHVHNMPDVLVFSGIVPRLLGAKIILDLHDPVPEVFRVIYGLKPDSFEVRTLELLERWSVGFSHVVLTPNIAFKRLFVARGCPEDKIIIVMNSPDETLFNPQATENLVKMPGFNLMFHGTLLERNGLCAAIEAIAQLRERVPTLKLHIYGERTPYIAEVMRQVDQIKLAPHVQYHGYKILEEVPEAISRIDFGVIPNLANPFNNLNLPTRIFEYLAMGKVPIVPRTEGILDYFQENELLFFKPGDADDLARTIEWAYLHPVQVQEVFRRGRRVYENHRWEIERKHFLSLVCAITGSPEVEETSCQEPVAKPALVRVAAIPAVQSGGAWPGALRRLVERNHQSHLPR
jgi:glycosyltransferase involved in cell wall biosynthesis